MDIFDSMSTKVAPKGDIFDTLSSEPKRDIFDTISTSPMEQTVPLTEYQQFKEDVEARQSKKIPLPSMGRAEGIRSGDTTGWRARAVQYLKDVTMPEGPKLFPGITDIVKGGVNALKLPENITRQFVMRQPIGPEVFETREAGRPTTLDPERDMRIDIASGLLGLMALKGGVSVSRILGAMKGGAKFEDALRMMGLDPAVIAEKAKKLLPSYREPWPVTEVGIPDLSKTGGSIRVSEPPKVTGRVPKGEEGAGRFKKVFLGEMEEAPSMLSNTSGPGILRMTEEPPVFTGPRELAERARTHNLRLGTSAAEDLAEKLIPPGERAPRIEISDKIPSDIRIAFERVWRPSGDIVNRYAPDITQVLHRFQDAGDNFEHQFKNISSSLIKRLNKAAPRGKKKETQEALIHLLNGTEADAIPAEVQSLMGLKEVQKVAKEFRSKVFDKIWAHTQEPEIQKLFGDTGYIKNYFPWARSKEPRDVFKTYVSEAAKGKGKYVRDPNAPGYKTGFMKPRKGGKLSNLNLGEVVDRYISGMRNSLFDVQAYDISKKLATRIPEGTEARSFLDQYLDFFVGAPSTRAPSRLLNKAINRFNAQTYFGLLSLPNIKSPAKNLSQIGNAIIEEGLGRTLQGIGGLGEGLKAYKGLGLLRETPGLEESALRSRGIISKTQRAGMRAFSGAEELLRGSSMKAGLKAAEKEGLSTKRAKEGLAQYFLSPAEERGAKTVRRTQFEYSKVNPVVMGNAPIQNLLKPFISFPSRQASFLYDIVQDVGKNWKTADRADSLRRLGRAMIVTGIGTGLGMDMLNIVAGESPGAAFAIHMKDFIRRGISDMQKMVQTGEWDAKEAEYRKEQFVNLMKELLTITLPGDYR